MLTDCLACRAPFLRLLNGQVVCHLCFAEISKKLEVVGISDNSSEYLTISENFVPLFP
jgi:uncharacterized Zn finger protein (UPF0148 family)